MSPEYSHQMLALFLQANAVHAAVRALGIDPLGGARVLQSEIAFQREEIRLKSGLKPAVFRCCWHGMMVKKDSWRAAWRAIGIDPEIGECRR